MAANELEQAILREGPENVAMFVPGSPEVLVWPLEWMILLALCLCGMVFWITGSRQRRETDHVERNSLILDET